VTSQVPLSQRWHDLVAVARVALRELT